MNQCCAVPIMRAHGATDVTRRRSRTGRLPCHLASADRDRANDQGRAASSHGTTLRTPPHRGACIVRNGRAKAWTERVHVRANGVGAESCSSIPPTWRRQGGHASRTPHSVRDPAPGGILPHWWTIRCRYTAQRGGWKSPEMGNPGRGGGRSEHARRWSAGGQRRARAGWGLFANTAAVLSAAKNAPRPGAHKRRGGPKQHQHQARGSG
jgi:hypothetical protein